MIKKFLKMRNLNPLIKEEARSLIKYNRINERPLNVSDKTNHIKIKERII